MTSIVHLSHYDVVASISPEAAQRAREAERSNNSRPKAVDKDTDALRLSDEDLP
jgi:hypothetical protein